MPQPRYLDAKGRLLPDHADAAQIAFTDYVITIKPGIRYQPHPAFARSTDGAEFAYHALTAAQLADINALSEFALTDSRELTADDYVYGLKRLAHPRLHSPIFGLMADYVLGLGDFATRLKAEKDQPWIDLRKHNLEGAEVIDRYRYRIRIKGKYPQFLYWLAMPFFAPMPWEADRFHSQPGMADKESDPRLVSDRHRPLHADREQPECTHGAGTEPEFS